jgi:hypothetical protein
MPSGLPEYACQDTDARSTGRVAIYDVAS